MGSIIGNWQPAGTLKISPESNDMFNLKNIKSKTGFMPDTNTVSTNTTVELKQPLSVNTVSPEGDPLDSKSFTAGQCKISKISKGFGTLQDCSVDGSGNVVYKYLVTAPKSPDPNVLYGVQISATRGTGEMMPGSGMGLNTFLFQIK